jgi:hypothetical protein
MGLSPIKPQGTVAANPKSTKKIIRVNNMLKTITVKAEAFTVLFVLEHILSFNPASATIAQPLKKCCTEKVEHFVIFDKSGPSAAGMTYIPVQLPLNITAIYNHSEIMEVNLGKIILAYFKSKIPQSFGKGIKTTADFFLKQLNNKMDKFLNVNKNFQMAKSFQNVALGNPCINHPSPLRLSRIWCLMMI